MKCFYHSADLDGHCSGEIVRHFNPECEIIPINYGEPFPWHTIERDEKVFMVDFCLQPFSDMIRLNGMCELIWIDHHKSAINASFAADAMNLKGIRKEGCAGCELVWTFFAGLYIMRYMAMDQADAFKGYLKGWRAVTLLGRYDVWDHADPDVLPFQYGMRLYDTFPGADIWNEVLWSGLEGKYRIEAVIDQGRTVLDYIARQNAKFCDTYSFESPFSGLRGLWMNSNVFNSQLFDSIWDPEKYDIMVVFCWTPGIAKWQVGLYSTKDEVDCAELARERGGGGHKGAAGFQCGESPLKGT